MKFIKENLLLSMGIFLPVLLMAVFYISQLASYTREAPPIPDFLFTVGEYAPDNTHFVRYNITGQRLTATVRTTDEDPQPPRRHQRLYRYDADTGEVKDISPILEQREDGSFQISLGALENLEINTAPVSENGYTFTTKGYRNSGLVSDIFGGSRNYNRSYVLKHDTIRYDVPLPAPHTGSYPVKFLGWIVSE